MNPITLPLIAIAGLLLAACTQEAPVSAAADPAPVAPIAEAAVETMPAASVREQEEDDEAPLRIRVADRIDAYPALAAAVRAAAENHRREMTAFAAELAADPDTPDWATRWSLEVDYSEPTGRGGLRVVVGDGHVYTGGAHGLPIIERYTYLVDGNRVLDLPDWFDGDDVWTALSEHSRRELIAQGEALHIAHGGAPEERDFWVEMIETGTEASPGSFSIYEPLLDEDGAVTGLRMIFPPYQVASYAEGPKTVDVPIHVVRPWLRPELEALLAAG